MYDRVNPRILLADSQSLLREAVRSVLADADRLDVVAEAGDGRSAIEEARRARPDVALVDAELPNPDGIVTTRSILADVPSCRVILLAADEDPELLRAAMLAGASGFLTKSSALEDLIEATLAVHQGDVHVPSRMLRGLLASLIDGRRERDIALKSLTRLTKREREVLGMLARGADNDAIALTLVISPETARTHIQNVLGKLKVHSRLEAAAFVIQRGLLEDLQPAEV